MRPSLEVLHGDPEFVVVDKPSGLSVHRGWDPDPDNALTRLRRQLGQWVWPVHRLDRGTSGCLLFALSEEMAGLLSHQFIEQQAKKSYLALVRGKPSESFEVDHPLPRGEGDTERLPARTTFRRLESSASGRYSLLQARPHSGRLHQIRRHLRHVRHPICGDSNWGDNKLNKVVKTLGLRRMALHAHELAIAHPRTGLLVVVTASWPEELAKAAQAMGIGG